MDGSRIVVLAGDPDLTDHELASALRGVFVDEGYTDARLADDRFSPASVRRRGEILVARDQPSGALAGTIMPVPPGGAARQIAQGDEAELHLLVVLPAWRGRARRRTPGSSSRPRYR